MEQFVNNAIYIDELGSGCKLYTNHFSIYISEAVIFAKTDL